MFACILNYREYQEINLVYMPVSLTHSLEGKYLTPQFYDTFPLNKNGESTMESFTKFCSLRVVLLYFESFRIYIIVCHYVAFNWLNFGTIMQNFGLIFLYFFHKLVVMVCYLMLSKKVNSNYLYTYNGILRMILCKDNNCILIIICKSRNSIIHC